jgi:hypothetical protein
LANVLQLLVVQSKASKLALASKPVESTIVCERKEKSLRIKIMKQETLRRTVRIMGLSVSTVMLAGLLNVARAQTKDTAASAAAIPSGTVLPVRLNSSLSSSKTKSGQIITARIMQDVPLANGEKIREGSKVIGHVVDVSSPANANTDQISLQFDALISSGRIIPIRTILRAVAGFVAVVQAGVPTDGPVSAPLATTQIGGDTAFTSGGQVDTADGAVVGKSVNDGVLDQARPGNRQGRDCQGVVGSNNSPQAMWVFSSDACGTYGLSNVRIEHAGKTEPVGVIVLTSEKGELKLPNDAGMLLRVE